MAVNRTFQAIITVLDRTAGPLRAIQARLRGLAPATLSAGQNLALIRDRLVAIGQNPALQRVGTAMARAWRRGVSLVSVLWRVGVGLTGLTAAAGLTAGGMVAMFRATVDATGAQDDMAKRLGTTVNELSSLQYAAMLSGVSAEEMSGSLEKLQRGMANAAAGQNKNLAELFQRLGIALRDSNGRVRSAVDVMPQLAQAFQRNGNAAVRTRMAMELFGRSGGPLITMLQNGRDAIAEQRQEWERLHGTMSDDAIQGQADLGDAMDRVKTAIQGVANAVTSQLAPVLTPLFNQLAEWIAKNREVVATKVEEWVTRIATAVSEWKIEEFITRLESWVETIGKVVDGLGGFENVLKLLIGLALAPLVASLFSMGSALFGLAAAAGAFTPAGAVIVGLAALGAGFKALYDNSKPFADMVDGLVSGLRELGRSALPRGEAPALPQQNFQDRSLLQGFYNGPAIDPETGLPAYPGMSRPAGRTPQLLLRRQSGTAVPAPRGSVEVNVNFEGVPRGARVDATSTGIAAPEVNVGYARMGIE